MRFSNAPRLIGHEDPFHLHKILGVTSLGHFGYRIVQCVQRQDHTLGFVSGDPWLLVWIAVHAALSGTSLIFAIPANRIRKLPMIWPEFRLHSILFAYRSLAAMLCFWADAYYATRMFSYARGVLVLATLIGADAVTAHYRRQEKLKPGETTMRSMPFPEGTPATVIRSVNFYYSVSQVLATMNILFTTNANRPFAVLFPIQLAAFLMTLVRKSVLSAGEWHIAYGAALGVNYVYAGLVAGEATIPMAQYWSLASAFVFSRFVLNVNKYWLWMWIVGIFWSGIRLI